MPYSPQDLKEIVRAEREFYELCFAHLLLSLAWYISHGMLRFDTIAERGDWLEDRAMRSVNRWRSHFCPERVGLPLDTEWPTV